jgi:hypothetical protein
MSSSTTHVILTNTHFTLSNTCYSHQHMLYSPTHVILTNTCYSHQHMLFSPTHVILTNTHVTLTKTYATLTNTCYSHQHMLYSPTHMSHSPKHMLHSPTHVILTNTRVAQWVTSLALTAHTSLSPIRRRFAPSFVNYEKGCTRLTAGSDKAYQLLAHGQWFSPGAPASSTTKTGRHDIAKILVKVALKQ